jgi:tetratricopeptide (TPR) repeat protein
LLAWAGRLEEACSASAEVVKVVRRDSGSSWLAPALHNFSIRLAKMGSYREALTASEEAVEQYRKVVQWKRQHYQQMESEDWDDDHRWAEWYLLERRQRRLAGAQAEVREAELDLCNELVNLSTCLHELNRLDEALAANAEAVAIARTHVDADKAASQPSLATALNNRSVLLSDMAKNKKALSVASEATALSAELAAANPEEYGPAGAVLYLSEWFSSVVARRYAST